MDKFLDILRTNARISLEDLAAMTDMTVKEAAERLDAYCKEGVIHGFSTVIDWEKTDVQRVSALIELRITPVKNYGFDGIAREIASFPQVESVYLMSGGFDLAVMLNAGNFREVAMFVSERLAPLDGVLSTATHFILRRYKDAGVSLLEKQKDERGEF